MRRKKRLWSKKLEALLKAMMTSLLLCQRMIADMLFMTMTLWLLRTARKARYFLLHGWSSCRCLIFYHFMFLPRCVLMDIYDVLNWSFVARFLIITLTQIYMSMLFSWEHVTVIIFVIIFSFPSPFLRFHFIIMVSHDFINLSLCGCQCSSVWRVAS